MTPKRVFMPILVALLAVMACGPMPSEASSAWDLRGPRADEIIMPLVPNINQMVISFERGDIDALPGLRGPAQLIDRLKSNRNADIVMTNGTSAQFLALNMRREPLSADPVRQAIACVVDRDAIARQAFNGSVRPLSTMVPPWSPFYNANAPFLTYDPAKAQSTLDQAGYKLDPKTKVRIDPNTGKAMRGIKLLTVPAGYDPGRFQAGKMIADSCRAIGLPVTHEPCGWDSLRDKLDAHDFDMCIYSGLVGRLADDLCAYYHSSQDRKHGLNLAGICDARLDRLLDEVNKPTDLAAARHAILDAQVILAEKQPHVMLCSTPRIDAFRKDRVTGYVPASGYDIGCSNKWTQLNIRNLKGGTGAVRWPLLGQPGSLNPCCDDRGTGDEVLSWIMDRLIEIHPETIEDEPWLAEGWEVGAWTNWNGEPATVVTWRLRDGVNWHDGTPLTSEDVKFTIDYLCKAYSEAYDSRQYWLIADVERVETPDRHTVKVYFRNHNCWQLYNLNDLWILPKHIWKDVKDYGTFEPWKEPHPTVKGLTKLIGVGPFMLKEYTPGRQIRLVKNPNYWRLNTAQ